MEDGLFSRLARTEPRTETERVLAQYFEAAYPHLALKNIATICEESGVSTASVTRYVRRLGYGSFREFSRRLQEEVAAGFDSPGERSRVRAGDVDQLPPGALWRRHVDVAQDVLGRMSDTLDGEEFDTVARLLADPERPVYLISVATGQALLSYFYLLARYYRDDLYLLGSTDRIAHELVNLPSNAVLLATQFDRHATSVRAVMKHFQSRGCATVLLTNRPTSPLLRYADHSLLIATESSSVFKSRVTMLVLLEALVEALEPRDPAMKQARIDAMQQVFDELGVFIHP